MRISLEQVEASRVAVDFASPDGAREVRLTELRGLTGQIESDRSGIRLRGVRAKSAAASGMEWRLPGGGRVVASNPAQLSAAAVDGEIAATTFRPLTVRASLSQLRVPALSVELPQGARLAADAGASDLALERRPEGTGFVSAERCELSNVQTAVAGAIVRVSGVALERPRVDWDGATWLGGAAAGAITGIAITGGGLSIEIDRVELAEGARTSGRSLVVPRLFAPEARIAVDDVVELLRPRAAPDAPAEEGRPFDFGFLDRITGRLEVDLTMDITVPVLGRRAATHHFRVPIVGGVINYKDVERDLSKIEDAFIDLEVRGGELVLERAIPLIPGLEKPLITWPLAGDDLELARKRLVRLRTIPRMQLPPRVKSEGKGAISIRRLHFGEIDIALSLPPLPPDQSDSIGRASVAELKIAGRIDHDTKRAGHAAATMVTLDVERAAAGPAELTLGQVALGLESIEVESVADAKVEFHGLRPRRATLTAHGITLRGLKIAL